MPCRDAMITKVITVSAEQTIDEALALLEKKQMRAAPVIDADNKLVGMFSLSHVLNSLLPVSVTMEDGLQRLDFVLGAAPGIAKRLKKLRKEKVSACMDTKSVVLHPETPTWEGIRLLVRYGSPLPVVDAEEGTLQGIITEQSALIEMTAMSK